MHSNLFLGLDICHTLCVQCVDLAQSRLSNAVHIPTNSADFDPDWEIDPKDLITLNKLGEINYLLQYHSCHVEQALLIITPS